MRRFVCILTLLFVAVISKSQEYPVSAIPDTLKAGAKAVIRYENCRFVQQDLNNATLSYTKVITLLKDGNEHYGDIVISQDKLRELKSFSGAIYNENGVLVSKIAKKDLKEYNYSSHILSDDKYSIYEFYPSLYPATIKYEYTIQYTKGIPSYPAFSPVDAFSVSVQESKYTLQVPLNQKIRYKNVNLDKPAQSGNESMDTYEWSVRNVKAIKEEILSPSLKNLSPVALISSDNFCMEGYCGNMNSWKDLGLWFTTLQQAKLDLPDDHIAKIKAMVKDADNDLEKVKILYDYLQKNTRYVSIQLGIGGLQPMSAANVAKTGFGDCKALSNYMMAMLKCVDIPSIYTIISTQNKNIMTDFASLTQMDHVILTVPLPNDTLWLECTSSIMPFNYVHSSIDGHQALWVLPQGGEICKVRANDNKKPTQTSCIKIDLADNPNAKASAAEYYRMDSYESKLSFLYTMSHEERVNHLVRNLDLPKVKILNINYDNKTTSDPSLRLFYEFEIERFVSKTANRLFVPLSILSYGASKDLKKEGRVHDIIIKSDIRQCDSLYISLPKEYTAESIPQSINTDAEFGNYKLSVSYENNTLCMIQEIYIKEGKYAPEKWADFYAFMRGLDKEVNKRAVFKIAEQ